MLSSIVFPLYGWGLVNNLHTILDVANTNRGPHSECVWVDPLGGESQNKMLHASHLLRAQKLPQLLDQ